MPTPATIRYAISGALYKDAVIDSDNIDVVCDGPDVWLSGSVDSFAAWRPRRIGDADTPGVGVVHNDIRILVPQLETP